MRRLFSVVCLQLLLIVWCSGADRSLVRPVAILLVADDTELLVADRERGLFSIRLTERPTESDSKILVDGANLTTDLMEGRFCDLAHAGDRRYAAIDSDTKQLVGFRYDGQDAQLLYAVDLDLDPRRVAINREATIACVTGRWSRAVQMMPLLGDRPSDKRSRIDLGFECEEVLALPDGRFLIADAFGGNLAVIDPVEVRIDSQREIHGHQIRGLAISDDRSSVLVSHQRLSRIARTDFDDIHWGSLMQNVVTEYPIDAFNLPQDAFRRAATTVALGDTGQGFADPTDLLSIPDGFFVLSGGAGQLLVVRDGDVAGRFETGNRPTRLAKLSGERLIALNEHSGSVSVISLDGATEPRTIQLTTDAPVTSGESAFYDARLSHDRWMTCSSCHVDGHSPGLVADTLGDGAFGNPKRIPSLLGIAETEPFGWLGNQPTLTEQIDTTLESTMRGKLLPSNVTSELVHFVKGLTVPDEVGDGADDEGQVAMGVLEGRELFESLKCNDCHGARKFTSAVARDVGMEDELGTRKFNPPSLHGVRLRRRLFHDARGKSLTDALVRHRHQVPSELTSDQLRKLVQYLKSL